MWYPDKYQQDAPASWDIATGIPVRRIPGVNIAMEREIPDFSGMALSFFANISFPSPTTTHLDRRQRLVYPSEKE